MKLNDIPAGIKISIGFFLLILLALVFNMWIKPHLGL